MRRAGFQHRLQWTCQSCTYQNSTSSNICSICENTRQTDPVYRETLIDDESSFHLNYSLNAPDCWSTYSVDLPDEANVPLSNVSIGIVLGAIGGVGVALLRGTSTTTGALSGATYGAIGGMLMNQSDQMISGSRETPSQSTESHSEQINRQLHQFFTESLHGDGAYDFGIPNILSSVPITDMDMSYESLIARFGEGHHQTAASNSSIDSLPTMKFSTIGKSDADDEKCSCVVCMENYATDDEISIMPCSHKFHRECIKTWLRQSNTCPICKSSL